MESSAKHLLNYDQTPDNCLDGYQGIGIWASQKKLERVLKFCCSCSRGLGNQLLLCVCFNIKTPFNTCLDPYFLFTFICFNLLDLYAKFEGKHNTYGRTHFSPPSIYIYIPFLLMIIRKSVSPSLEHQKLLGNDQIS